MFCNYSCSMDKHNVSSYLRTNSQVQNSSFEENLLMANRNFHSSLSISHGHVSVEYLKSGPEYLKI